MLYDIRHRTIYDYGSRVGSARIITHLEPRTRGRQTVETCAVRTEPLPLESTAMTDFFGNAVRTMRFVDLPATLVIEATATVRVEPWAEPAADASPDWSRLRDLANGVPDIGRDSPVHMLFPSRHVPLLVAAADLLEPLLGCARPIVAVAGDLMRLIHEAYVYDPEATEVSTPLTQVLAVKRGVCQDFAHLMIAALRGHGLPAAYVSGYLRTAPPPGRERLVGADATHAWVEVWCGPDLGWIGFDPTNAVLAGPDHVVLAVGRDYADVAPVAGVVTVSDDQHIEVEVDMVPVGEGELAAPSDLKLAAPGRA